MKGGKEILRRKASFRVMDIDLSRRLEEILQEEVGLADHNSVFLEEGVKDGHAVRQEPGRQVALAYRRRVDQDHLRVGGFGKRR